jgi:coatomer subunit beta
MANSTERSCSMLVFNDKAITASEIKEALEHGDAETKAAAMRKAITMLLAGEQLPQVGVGWGKRAPPGRAP